MSRASSNTPIALRIQGMDLQSQTLVLSHLAQFRTNELTVAPGQVSQLFDAFALPPPAKIANVFSALVKKKLVTKLPGRGIYRVTPYGREKVSALASELDLAALIAESVSSNAPLLGHTELSLVPPSLAPPGLVHPLRSFIAEHPFDNNVFGMTRFPDTKAGTSDPMGRALAITKEICADFGLEFHLASDRAITDDLWTNVTAHMWACRYGIAFFEDTVERGLNHNLLIEVGAMLMTGRRCAMLKDGSIEKMPTDFVGMIYKSVDLADETTVVMTVQNWIKSDLRIDSK